METAVRQAQGEWQVVRRRKAMTSLEQNCGFWPMCFF